MSWTSENYPKVREHLPERHRGAFDQMANDGRRLLEALDGAPLIPAVRSWIRACDRAEVPVASSHTLRLDYIKAAVEARRG
jgi:predicted anti-sigma-YlaC factor YlaD